MIRAAFRRLKFLGEILASNSQRKHARRWVRSLSWLHHWRRDYLLNTPSPWITFDALDFIQQSLARHPKVFEYGSGGSTIFWSKFDPTLLVSVEHAPAWYAQVAHQLGDLASLDYRLIYPEPNSNGARDPADPDAYVSDDPALSSFEFRKYVTQIDSFPDDYFDVVMIDGRARPSCIKHGVSKVAPGGFLILDNAERSYYTTKTQSYLRDFDCCSFSGVGPCLEWMWRTDIYIRKK